VHQVAEVKKEKMPGEEAEPSKTEGSKTDAGQPKKEEPAKTETKETPVATPQPAEPLMPPSGVTNTPDGGAMQPK
jgi:hypothetical protein